MSPENTPDFESNRRQERKRKLAPHLFEAVKNRLGMSDEEIDTHAADEVIVPLEGLEDKTYSLPERAQDGGASESHFDDWIVTGETADDRGNLTISLSRYRDDGSIESRTDIPVHIFESYQVKVDAERRFRDAQSSDEIGASPTAMDRIRMVRNLRNDPDRADLLDAEQQSLAESRSRLAEKRQESLDRIKEDRAKKRRENPMRYLLRGKHHQGRTDDEA